MLKNYSRTTLIFIILYLSFLQGITAQNVDSIFSIWYAKDKPFTERLAAINQLLISGDYYYANIDKAFILAIEQFNLAKQEGLYILLTKAYLNRVALTHLKEQHYQSIDLANECLSLYADYLTNETEGMINLWKAQSLYKLGKSQEALSLINSIGLKKEVPKRLLIKKQNIIGLIHYRSGEYSEAIDAHQKYVALVKDLPDAACHKSIYNTNLGNIYYALKELPKAITYYEQSIEQQKICGRESNLISKLANLAKIFVKQKEYEKAIQYYTTSLELAKKYAKKSFILDNQTEIANIYVKQNKQAKAKTLFANLEKLAEEAEDYEAIAYYCYSLGKFSIKENNLQNAFDACKKGFDACEKSNHLFGKKLCAECLLNVSELQKNWKAALNWQSKVNALKDSIINLKIVKKTAKLEAESKYQENLLLLQYEKETNQLQKRLLLFFLIAAMILATALWWIYGLEKKKGSLLGQKNELLQENLSKQKTIEKHIEEINKMDKLKTKFFANIAHEFQTPLTIINGLADNLLKSETSSLVDKISISSISKNSKNLIHLTAQILTLRENNDWETVLTVNQFQLYEIFNPILHGYESLAQENELEFEFDYNGLHELMLLTDASKLVTIITNLLSNAIKYSKPKGFVAVTCNKIEDQLQIRVVDNGQGIPTTELSNIFKRYTQISSEKNKFQQPGFGIGLSICKEYANLLQGMIKVDSTLKEGSTFTVTIPIALAAIDRTKIQPLGQEISLPILSTADSRAIEVIRDTALETILIVEDNKDIWLLLKNIFHKKYNLIFKADGLQALTYLKTAFLPNLVITDIMMPYMDGVSLIKEIKSIEKLNTLPILVLTAKNNLANELKNLNLIIDDYVLKPFDNQILLARTEHLLKLREERLQALEKKEVLLDEKKQLWLSKVEKIIYESLSDFDLSPHKVAEAMNLSEVHLNRKLKETIGFTVSKYILEARFRKALELLENKEVQSVKEVCYSVGLKTPKYFSRNFKKRFGKYPSDYL